MKTLISYSIIIFLIISIGCTENSKNTEVTQSKEILKADVVKSEVPGEEIIFLQGIYATSTALPFNQNSIDNILDGDKETTWKTIKGAGPDEGIMLYFENPLYIETAHLITSDKSEAKLKTVTVYADGKNLGDFEVNKPFGIKNTISSLFIRIKNTEDISTETDTYKTIFIEKFNSTKSIAISDLQLSDESGKKYKIAAPIKLAGEVLASSTLKPVLSYHVNQLFDSRKEFVWAEGAAGSGENESVHFNLQTDISIDALQLWNGFQRSDKHFTENARVKKFEFGTEGNTVVYEVKDEKTPQRIKLQSALTGKKFVFKVLEVYPGKTYKDLVISELRLYNGVQPMIIENKETEKNIATLQSTAKGTVLENYLDKRIKCKIEEASTSDYSIILRSDNTFVSYALDEMDGDSKEVIADGGWEVLELNENEAKIRVFGKLLDLSQTLDYYKGTTSTSSFLRIFQDKVTLTKEAITGEKFIQHYYTQIPASN